MTERCHYVSCSGLDAGGKECPCQLAGKCLSFDAYIFYSLAGKGLLIRAGCCEVRWEGGAQIAEQLL